MMMAAVAVHVAVRELFFAQALIGEIEPADDTARVSYIKALGVLADYSTAQPVIEEYLRR